MSRVFLPALAVGALLWAGPRLVADEPTEAEQFAAQAKQLAPQTPKPERLVAVEWLLKCCARPPAPSAMPALERCIRQDPDVDVRRKAVEALAMIAYQPKHKVCPVAVVEAFNDRDAEVRSIAQGCAGMFREFAPGATEALLKAARHADPLARGPALYTLAYAAARDEKAQEVIRAARTDPDFRVRNDAHSAWFVVTNKLEDIVPHRLRTLAEFRDEPPLPPNSPEAAKTEKTWKNLLQIGAALHLQHAAEERTDEVAKLVLAHLDDKDAVLRRGAACLAGDLARWHLQTLALMSRQPFIIQNYVDPKEKPKDPEPTPKLLVRLQEMKIEERLRKLQRDPVEAVRLDAAVSLEQLAALKAKKP
jgi:hypothetical protein